ncbi:hypothetical protein [Nostoc sp. JL33]|uniref:hypothetical protein n=1 Tax=Nostoc sp. JL33 TaxID=2815396 RepID=UPI0025D53A6E|nr:hypothetical protein [Nostoc sp. JL33]
MQKHLQQFAKEVKQSQTLVIASFRYRFGKTIFSVVQHLILEQSSSRMIKVLDISRASLQKFLSYVLLQKEPQNLYLWLYQ